MWPRTSNAWLCALALVGCNGASPTRPDAGSAPDGSPDAGPDAGDAGGDAGPSRDYLLASGGVQLLVDGGLGFLITPANLAQDADVAEVHQEFYGIPWDAFAAGTDPPPEWVAALDGIAGGLADAGQTTFLSVTMLNGMRNSLTAKTSIVNGTVQTTDGWAATCYDFASAPDGAAMKQAYLAYVGWMIDHFSPAYLNMAVEVNLFFENCPASAAGVIDVANAAYALAKSKNPALVTFPSFQIDHLYGYADTSCPDAGQRAACFQTLYAQIASMRRDRFAMSTYPSLGVVASPAELPSDWFTRGASVASERPLIAETGWNSSSLVAQLKNGTCDTVYTATDSDEEAYLDFVLNAAAADDIDLVNWWSDRDLIVSQLMTDCPCSFDAVWCEVLDIFRGPATDGGGDPQFYGEVLAKAFGTMGLRDYEGNPKPVVYPRWQSALDTRLAR
jgi:hypothetical protein